MFFFLSIISTFLNLSQLFASTSKMKRHHAILLPGCLQVSDDSLSSHLYQSAPVQLFLPPTFRPLALAVISDDHSRFGFWKMHTDCKHAETQACL